MSVKVVLMFIAMISCTVVANLLLKTGAVTGDSGREGLAHLLNWRVLLGLVAFGLAAGLYLLILRWLPLNVAQSFTAAQFIAVILASSWILSEEIGRLQWLGIALIAAGISVVGWSQR